MSHVQIDVIDQISGIECSAWNALLPDSNPFLRHEFLSALETYHCVTPDTGWQAKHFLVKNNQNELIGAMPAYLKHNSFGEFVFDWSWATAYENAGLIYYPKLVSAIPFTPVTGLRLLISRQVNREVVSHALIEAAKNYVDANKLSSFHCLFPDISDIDHFSKYQLLKRSAYQYHWHNQNYQDFDHFLSFFRSQKRKNAKRGGPPISNRN